MLMLMMYLYMKPSEILKFIIYNFQLLYTKIGIYCSNANFKINVSTKVKNNRNSDDILLKKLYCSVR